MLNFQLWSKLRCIDFDNKIIFSIAQSKDHPLSWGFALGDISKTDVWRVVNSSSLETRPRHLTDTELVPLRVQDETERFRIFLERSLVKYRIMGITTRRGVLMKFWFSSRLYLNHYTNVVNRKTLHTHILYI